MKNRFRKGEVVLVDGIGKISEKKHRQLGIIEAKEYFYNEYLITLISSKTEDWFREKDIKIVMERNFKKQEKFKVVLAIDIRGIEIIERKINSMPNKNNNIFNYFMPIIHINNQLLYQSLLLIFLLLVL